MEKTPEVEEVKIDGSMEVFMPSWMGELESQEIYKIMEHFTGIMYRQELGPLHGSCICYAMANMIVGILKQSISVAQEPGSMAGVMMTASGIASLMEDAAGYVQKQIPDYTMRLFGEPEGSA